MNTSPIVHPVIDPKFYTSTPTKKLDPKAELFQLEHEIELHWTASASKLQIIKDKELWRADNYKSWGDYCERRWQKPYKQVHQMLADAKIALGVRSQLENTPVGGPETSELLENGESISEYSDINPAQARALSKVPKKRRAAVVKKVIGANGHLTARAISECGKPKHMLSVWRDLQEFYGKALNRLDEAHRITPNAERRNYMMKITKGLMKEASIWQEESK